VVTADGTANVLPMVRLAAMQVVAGVVRARIVSDSDFCE
jgi:hypothetical protein